MRVVLDTNILISALFWRGNPYNVVLNALKKKYVLYLSQEILNELEEKLRIKFRFPEDKIRNHIGILRENGKVTEPDVKLDIIREDPDDNKFLECAVSCNADFIVSGDKHILKLKEFKGIKILTAKEFLDLIK